MNTLLVRKVGLVVFYFRMWCVSDVLEKLANEFFRFGFWHRHIITKLLYVYVFWLLLSEWTKRMNCCCQLTAHISARLLLTAIKPAIHVLENFELPCNPMLEKYISSHIIMINCLTLLLPYYDMTEFWWCMMTYMYSVVCN